MSKNVLENVVSISDSLNKYVVAPSAAFGVAGFVFDVEGDTNVTHQADITDHYVEDNSAVQDHIAIKPKKITLRNYVGELVYYGERGSDAPLRKLAQKLTTLTAYLPVLTQGAQQVKDILDDAKSGESDFNGVVSDLANLWSLTKSMIPAQQKQAQAYEFFKALHEKKVLSSVQTPYGLMTNMAIDSISVVQEEGSKYISTFTLVFKEIRSVSTQTVSFDEEDFQGRAGLQIQSQAQQGIMKGLDPSSLPKSLPALNKFAMPLGTIQRMVTQGAQLGVPGNISSLISNKFFGAR